MQQYWKADFLTALTDEAIAAHVEHGTRTPCLNSTMHLYAINGAAHRVGDEETAFGHRDKDFAAVIVGAWPEPTDNDANTAWVKNYYAAIHPHSGGDGGYVNFMSDDDAQRTEANFGCNYRRLQAVKTTWDPDNLFRFNQNIPPG
jgi:Berberine and berberine like